MKTVTIDPDFQAWRSTARALLAEKTHPDEVLWDSSLGGKESLLSFDKPPQIQSGAPRLQVPRQFVRLAEMVSCHRSGKQWAQLYKILWMLTYDRDKDILQDQTDSTMRSLERMRATVSRDLHKMRAFVRFREVKADDCNRENYVAWYEPEHLVLKINAPFFKKRFGGVNWSILTPDECVHWDGRQIRYSEGVQKSLAPDGDELEEYWLRYYRSTFNPARVKIKMMQSEMPKKYWKNLPEAEIIEELIHGSSDMVQEMMVEEQKSPKDSPENAYLKSLKDLGQG
ncbi:MAG: TIGR03915 family putative DNA repair protein [Verrucomicrobiae bacterium]|nr:TIGR03915 family putative DNA repair protein [Verrucomicrobiae bacterium]NNJ86009.1 DUF4130 domain-containing protein [Akkermansiaceae bacterium]